MFGKNLRHYRRSFVLLAFLCTQAPGLLAQRTDAQVRIESAVLGQSRANLYAKCTGLKVEAGLNEFAFTGLGASINPSSIKIKTTAGARVVSFRLDSNNQQRINDEYRAFESLIKSGWDTLKMVEFRLERLQMLQGVLMENKKISVSDKSIYVDDLDELLDFFREKLMSIYREKTRLEYHRKAVNHQIDSLETAKNELAATLGLKRPALNVQIASENDQEIEMEFWYEVKGVAWSPGYSVSLLENGQALVSMASHLVQNTGVPWNDVQMSLRYGTQDQIETSETQLVNPSSSEPFSLIQLDNPITLVSGKASFLSNISQYDVNYEVTNYCLPEQTNQVFENIKFTGLSGVYLPQGDAVIEGSEKGQISNTLKSLFFDDSLSYSLGFSNNIIATRQLEKEKFKKAIIGNKQSITVSWELTIENLRDKDAVVILKDRLPSTQNSAVVIENNLPKGSVIDDQFFTHEIKLKSNQKSVINYGFQISAPKGVTIKDYYNN